jgi:uncharacterized protein YkuJ
MVVNIEIIKLINRLKSIGIEVDVWTNYPWIYLYKINGTQVQEKDFFLSEHGFCLAIHPLRESDRFKFTDISKIFKIIRKYK